MDATSIGIVAAGTYIPAQRISAAEIARLAGLPEQVVTAKLGIESRPLAGPDDHPGAVDPRNPRTRFMLNLSCGGGALLLRRNHPHNRLLGTAIISDGSFALDVIIPAGGTVEPLTAEALDAGRTMLDVTDPEGMKRRLDDISMGNFMAVIDTALARSGRSRADIGYLNLLHMKRSAHEFVLRELGLREDQSCYLSDTGHIGQQDQMISIRRGLESGRLRDGDLMVMVAAGIGYVWAAACVQWG